MSVLTVLIYDRTRIPGFVADLEARGAGDVLASLGGGSVEFSERNDCPPRKPEHTAFGMVTIRLKSAGVPIRTLVEALEKRGLAESIEAAGGGYYAFDASRRFPAARVAPPEAASRPPH